MPVELPNIGPIKLRGIVAALSEQEEHLMPVNDYQQILESTKERNRPLLLLLIGGTYYRSIADMCRQLDMKFEADLFDIGAKKLYWLISEIYEHEQEKGGRPRP